MDPDPITFLTEYNFINPIENELISSLIVLVLLLATSALISGSEVAFFSFKPEELNRINKYSFKNAKNIQTFLSKPKQLLATILITNNFVNVGIIMLSSYVCIQLFNFKDLIWLQFLVQVVIITFLLLLFGEVLPKVYANNKALSFAKFMIRPLVILDKLFKPLSYLLVSSTKIIDRRVKKRKHKLSINDLSNALELTKEKNENVEEKKILEGIVKFGNTDVKQIMKSRVDITAINIKDKYTNVQNIIIETGYSRIPVYQDSLDQIKGILYIKDLLPHLNTTDNFEWKNLIRDAFFVPENKKIDDLLKEFQDKKIHLAIVVDEYGGTSGIVTLEDIIEEIVGDISDEFDDDDIVYSKLDNYNYVFEGKTPLNDFYRILNIDGELFEKEKGESDTLAGFILELNKEIPDKGLVIKFNHYLFTVEGVNKRRITRIKISISQENEI